jgi:predicted transposase/invertase (TIGR01784 family)
VFGSEHHTQILVDLLTAVLQPPPGEQVESVTVLNPLVEPLRLDDKLSVLDLRACDQTGRQFDVEMQMANHSGLKERFLAYWARLYSGQLRRGEGYEDLKPVVSICFLDWREFPETDEAHLRFELRERKTNLRLSDRLAMHVFQLPNFAKGVDAVSCPLDRWLCFLNNAEAWSQENLPEAMRTTEVEEAMSILHTISQDEIEWQRYLSREKARLDALNREKSMEAREARAQAAEAEAAEAKTKAAEAKTKAAEAKTKAAEAKTKAAEAEAKAAEAEAKLEAAVAKAEADIAAAKGEARAAELQGLIDQIRLCEEFLGLAPLPEEQLGAMSVEDLKELLAERRRQKRW